MIWNYNYRLRNIRLPVRHTVLSPVCGGVQGTRLLRRSKRPHDDRPTSCSGWSGRWWSVRTIWRSLRNHLSNEWKKFVKKIFWDARQVPPVGPGGNEVKIKVTFIVVRVVQVINGHGTEKVDAHANEHQQMRHGRHFHWHFHSNVPWQKTAINCRFVEVERRILKEAASRFGTK